MVKSIAFCVIAALLAHSGKCYLPTFYNLKKKREKHKYTPYKENIHPCLGLYLVDYSFLSCILFSFFLLLLLEKEVKNVQPKVKKKDCESVITN